MNVEWAEHGAMNHDAYANCFAHEKIVVGAEVEISLYKTSNSISKYLQYLLILQSCIETVDRNSSCLVPCSAK